MRREGAEFELWELRRGRSDLWSGTSLALRMWDHLFDGVPPSLPRVFHSSLSWARDAFLPTRNTYAQKRCRTCCACSGGSVPMTTAATPLALALALALALSCIPHRAREQTAKGVISSTRIRLCIASLPSLPPPLKTLQALSPSSPNFPWEEKASFSNCLMAHFENYLFLLLNTDEPPLSAM